MLSEKMRCTILDMQKIYPEKRSALIPALHLVQKEQGYLSHETQSEIANLFEIQSEEVHKIVAFSNQFSQNPVGKHVIRVCKSLSCMLRGSDAVLSRLCQKLTACDGAFTVIESECLAACDLAPMMLIDGKAIGPVQCSDLDQILAEANHE